MTIDVGTGDGRAVLAAAAAAPNDLVIGVDADARSMRETSRRAAGPARKSGVSNAMFLLAAAESMPPELTGIADLVTVRFPWGSLLRGCVGMDGRVADGIARLAKGGGVLELLLAPTTRDALVGIPTTPVSVAAAATTTFERRGMTAVEARLATIDEVHASHSTWARRLHSGRHRSDLDGTGGDGGRAVILVRLRSSAP